MKIILSTLVIGCFIFLFLILSYISPIKKLSFSNLSQIKPSAQLYFKPKIITSTCRNAQETADIYLNSNGIALVGSQVELLFDPNTIYNVTMQAANDNFFGEKKDYQIQLMEVREQYGRVSFYIEKNSDQAEKTGDKKIATVTFQTVQGISESSTISFLNKSTAKTRNTRVSLLKETVPLTIICK